METANKGQAMARYKTFTFAAVHMSVAFAVGYAMTGSAAVGGALALVEPLVNTVAYYFHERAWNQLTSLPKSSKYAG
jgi:uncharacterized membrane protein